MAAGGNDFDPNNPEPPSEGALIVYTDVLHPANGWSVADSNGPIAEFTAEDNALSGTITLEYGLFDDPAAVTVTMLDVALTVPAVKVGGMFIGPGIVRLREDKSDAPVTLIYEPAFARLRPVGSGGIPLAIDYGMGPPQDVTFWFEGSYAPSGRLFISGNANTPLPAGIPTISQWGLVILALLIVATGTILFRRGAMKTVRHAAA